MGGAGEGRGRERGDASGENGTAVHVLCLGFGVGYLVPLFGTSLDEELKEIFVGELRGWGLHGQQ